MTLSFNDFHSQPGIEAARETYEAAISWGRPELALITGRMIGGATRDSGNATNATELRVGLLLGKKTSDNKLYHLDADANDGTQVLEAILLQDLKITDSDGNDKDRFSYVLVGGPVKESGLVMPGNASGGSIGWFAKSQLWGRWALDTQLAPAPFPFRAIKALGQDYQATSADSGTLFTNENQKEIVIGGGDLYVTLPPFEAGWTCSIYATKNGVFGVRAGAGDFLVRNFDYQAKQFVFNTEGEIVGGGAHIMGDPHSGKWLVWPAQGETQTTITASSSS